MSFKYRKRPVVIEAVQFKGGGEAATTYPTWFSEALCSGKMWFQGGEAPYLTIKTLEGEMRADLGDWIIRGVNHELYPCKDEIFWKTYESVE